MLLLRAVRISYDEITRALRACLAARGMVDVPVALQATEAPRAWGVTTNVCFGLGGRLAASEIERQSAGLDKKAAKQLAAQLARAAAEQLAAEIASELASGAGAAAIPFIARIEAEGAYINFYYDVPALAAHVVGQVLAPGGRPALAADPTLFGHGAPTGRQIMVEYAQPNTHKDFHVGHLRNASIGQAIANLLEFHGHTVYKATYIGDVGKHIAIAMFGDLHRDDPNFSFLFQSANELANSSDRLAYWGACYKGGKAATAKEVYPEGQSHALPGTPYLESSYVGQQVERHVIALAIIESILLSWEDSQAVRHKEVRQAWTQSRQECDKQFRRIFAELFVDFDADYWFYESTVEEQNKLDKQAAAELKNLHIAQVDESAEYKGALYVDFEKHAEAFPEERRKRIKQLGKMTILRSDGTSLYQTKELGLAKHKFDLILGKTGRPLDESLYVVGAEQKLYFEQVFAILHLWGFPNADNCKHISYELVVLPEGKMSSREGNIVSYRELRDEAVARAEAITREKGIGATSSGGAIDEAKVKDIAHKIAIAAIKYAMLQVTGSQQITFNFEQALSFDGRAAPYLQYAYARARKLVEGMVGQASSLSEDTGKMPVPLAPPGYELHASEVELARCIARFPDVCVEAAQAYEPATLCTYLYDLACAFSDFYRDCRVLDAPEPQRGFRQRLCAAFRTVMKTGFAILALPLPEEM